MNILSRALCSGTSINDDVLEKRGVEVRTAGIGNSDRVSLFYSYLQYSAICARLLRQALKPEFKAKALKQEESNLKVSKWKNGEPGKSGTRVSNPKRFLKTMIARVC